MNLIGKRGYPFIQEDKEDFIPFEPPRDTTNSSKGKAFFAFQISNSKMFHWNMENVREKNSTKKLKMDSKVKYLLSAP